MDVDKTMIVGASIEECIHVAGILNFFQIAENFGYKTQFLGPAVKLNDFLKAIANSKAGIIAISYRLTPDNGKRHLEWFVRQVTASPVPGRRYFLGCLPGLEKYAKAMHFFDAIFTGGETVEEIMTVLYGISENTPQERNYPQDLLGRIASKKPYPILRAHFGLPSLEKTIDGAKRIAEATILDIISIAPDQAAQEWLQRPDVLKTKESGAGGVPIRSRDDLIALYQQTRCGNHPLLRIYSGTQDLVDNGKLFSETIHNAWAAVPVFWYSELDGRGPNSLENAIKEHIDAIRWHARNNIPVEVNDPHQWGLRMAPDHLVVADAYLSARVAKNSGVKTFVQQLMFNTPAGNTYKMDLARVLAMIEIVQPLVDEKFAVLKETRAGLTYLSPRAETAMGQLCASTMMQMAVRPHIMHVVSYCEGDHAAEPEDIVYSCKLINRVIQDSLHGLPDVTIDPSIQERKNLLLEEATVLLLGFLQFARDRGYSDPFMNPTALASAVREGIFDAPQLKGNKAARGSFQTRILDGTCIWVNGSGKKLPERERLVDLGLDIEQFDKQGVKQLYVIQSRGDDPESTT
nr:methionine synthase [Candidatus Sigynarchaeota archaeon]